MAKGRPRILCCGESVATELCDKSFKGRLPHRCHSVLNHYRYGAPGICFRCKRPFKEDTTAITV